MSACVQLDLSFSPAQRARARRMPVSWKAYAAQLTRYRCCVHLGLGRAWACALPWQPGNAAHYERMGPVRRPCPPCEVRYACELIIARALRAEVEQEDERIASMSYRAWLESDQELMRMVERALAGDGNDGCSIPIVTALVMLREHGSVEAALEDLRDDAYAMDSWYFEIVRHVLRCMDTMTKREVFATDMSSASAAADAERIWTTEPNVARVLRLPGRMDRTRILGNSVVPQCAEVVGHVMQKLAGAAR